MSNSQLNKLKSGINNGTEVDSNFSSNMIGDSNDEISFPHKLSLIHTQVSRIRTTLNKHGSSANINYQKLKCPRSCS